MQSLSLLLLVISFLFAMGVELVFNILLILNALYNHKAAVARAAAAGSGGGSTSAALVDSLEQDWRKRLKIKLIDQFSALIFANLLFLGVLTYANLTNMCLEVGNKLSMLVTSWSIVHSVSFQFYKKKLFFHLNFGLI